MMRKLGMRNLRWFTVWCLVLTVSVAEAQLVRDGAAQRSAQQSDARLSVVAPAPDRATGSATGSSTMSGAAGEAKSDGAATAATVALTHPRNHVLLVGVNKYPEVVPSTQRLVRAQFGDLRFAVDDMQALKSALVQARFCRDEDIRILVSGAGGKNEPTSANVEDAFTELLAAIKEGDRVLVAFSGHGIALPMEERTVDFLCCADAVLAYNNLSGEFEERRGIIRRTWLEEELDKSNASVRLVFIDACRNVLAEMSGVLKSDGVAESDAAIRAIGGIRGVSRFGNGAPSVIRNGLFRFSSCAPEEVSWEFGSKGHGVFTYFLLEGMLGKAARGNSKEITLADLVSYVRRETSIYVRSTLNASQNPVVARLPVEASLLESEIVFSFVGEPVSVVANQENGQEDQQEQVQQVQRPTQQPMQQPTQPVPVQLQVQRELREKVLADYQDFLAMFQKGNTQWMNTVAGKFSSWKEAAELGMPEGQMLSGHFYLIGHGVPQNSAEGIRLIRKAADQGNEMAQVQLASSYLHGLHGIPKNEAEGIRLLRKLADQGNEAAQLLLVICYISGHGIPKDEAEGIRLLRKLAEQGNEAAQIQLALLSIGGHHGIPKNEAEGVRLLRKLAEQGNETAQMMLKQLE